MSTPKPATDGVPPKAMRDQAGREASVDGFDLTAWIFEPVAQEVAQSRPAMVFFLLSNVRSVVDAKIRRVSSSDRFVHQSK